MRGLFNDRKGSSNPGKYLGIALGVSFLAAVLTTIFAQVGNSTYLQTLGVSSTMAGLIALVVVFGVVYLVAKLFGMKV